MGLGLGLGLWLWPGVSRLARLHLLLLPPPLRRLPLRRLRASRPLGITAWVRVRVSVRLNP